MGTLKNYLQNNKITQRDFSKKLNVHFMTVHLICSGKRRPSPQLALRIEQETQGGIGHDELLYPENQKGADGKQ